VFRKDGSITAGGQRHHRRRRGRVDGAVETAVEAHGVTPQPYCSAR
jgi:hypothetical protein